MKFIFLAGGFAGFALTAGAGLSAGRDLSLVLRDAAFGCLAGALLFRWFWTVLVRTLRETVELKVRAATPPASPAPATGKPVSRI
jgi:hypothetical protein